MTSFNRKVKPTMEPEVIDAEERYEHWLRYSQKLVLIPLIMYGRLICVLYLLQKRPAPSRLYKTTSSPSKILAEAVIYSLSYLCHHKLGPMVTQDLTVANVVILTQVSRGLTKITSSSSANVSAFILRSIMLTLQKPHILHPELQL